jgi:hypothetical protein
MRELTKLQADSLIKRELLKEDKSLKGQGVEAFVLKNGKAIAVEAGEFCTEFESIKALKDYFKPHPKAHDILYNSNPYGKDVVNHFDILIDQLLDYLGIKEIRSSSISQSDLQSLDSAISSQNKFDSLRSEYLINCTALIAKIVKNYYGDVKIDTKLSSEDNVTWYPVINCYGKEIPTDVYVYTCLLESDLDKMTLSRSFEKIARLITGIKMDLNPGESDF